MNGTKALININKNISQTHRLAQGCFTFIWQTNYSRVSRELYGDHQLSVVWVWLFCSAAKHSKEFVSLKLNRASVKALTTSWVSDFRDQWGIAAGKRTKSVNICQSKAPNPSRTKIRLMIIANEIGGPTLADLQTGLLSAKNVDLAHTLVI